MLRQLKMLRALGFYEEYRLLCSVNRDLEADATLGLRIEHKMLRFEKAVRHVIRFGTMPVDCVTCATRIPEKRRKACPEALWCAPCSDEYDRMKGKPWTDDQQYGTRL